MPVGRPNLVLSQEEKDELIAHLEDGGGMVRWVRSKGHSYQAVWDFIDKDEAFSAILQRAKKVGAQSLIEQAREIIDDESGDFYEDGDKLKPNPVKVARAKLRAEHRKWLASKLDSTFDDKLGLHGAEGLPPVATTSTFLINGVKPNGTG